MIGGKEFELCSKFAELLEEDKNEVGALSL